MKTKIYTKTGDLGETSLFGGQRVLKSDLRLAAYGAVDELNASLGVVQSEMSSIYQLKTVTETIVRTQNFLFSIGSHLACADEKIREQLPPLVEDMIAQLEVNIDELETELPELKEFILPGGTKAAAALHLSRTICRRAERNVVAFFAEKSHKTPKEIQDFVVRYMNRLGDYLFVAARRANVALNSPEIKWQKQGQ